MGFKRRISSIDTLNLRLVFAGSNNLLFIDYSATYDCTFIFSDDGTISTDQDLPEEE